MYSFCNENVANDNNRQSNSEQSSNDYLYNEQNHCTVVKNSNSTNTLYDYTEMYKGQILTSEFNELSMINSENLEEINTAALPTINSYSVSDSVLSSSINSSASTNVSPLLNFLTALSSDNVPSSLNNYEENSYREIQIPSTNFTVNGYANAEVHSRVVYPQYGHEPPTVEEYYPNQIGSETTPLTEGFYNHGPEYLQDVNYENQVYYPSNQDIWNQNQPISMLNNSLNSRAGMNNKETGVKRSRQVYTKFQIKTLEDEYEKNNYIKKARKAELAKLLSLSETKIKIWFQNRRTKAKKQLTLQ